MPELLTRVISGQHAGEYNLYGQFSRHKKNSNPMPDFVLAKNIKLLMKNYGTLQYSGDNLDGNEADDMSMWVSLFAGHAESPMTMKGTKLIPTKSTGTTLTATMNSRSTSSRLVTSGGGSVCRAIDDYRF